MLENQRELIKNEGGNLVKERTREKEHYYYFNIGSGKESEHYQCPHLRFSLRVKKSSVAVTDCNSATFRKTCSYLFCGLGSPTEELKHWHFFFNETHWAFRSQSHFCVTTCGSSHSRGKKDENLRAGINLFTLLSIHEVRWLLQAKDFKCHEAWSGKQEDLVHMAH